MTVQVDGSKGIETNNVVFVTSVAEAARPQKKLCDAYILAIALGFLGAHHFYLRRPGFGVLYLCTFGLLGVGYIADWFRVPWLVKDANKRFENPNEPQEKSLSDAYILWFPCGLFGFHHFYLRRPCWGVLYLCTFGLIGVGWLIDGIRMKHLVDMTNEKLEAVSQSLPKKKNVSNAYVLALCPITGLLGFHHYYLKRTSFGLLYSFTLGLLGVGYLYDWFRVPILVTRANKKIEQGDDRKKTIDDAYILLFPLGFLGLHHFYLRRYGWGVLYLCTFGCLGIGWLMDFFRLPCLVRDYNQNIENSRVLGTVIVGNQPGPYGVINPAAVTTDTAPGIYPGSNPPGYYPGGYPNMYQQGGYPYPPNGNWQPVAGYGPPSQDSMLSIDSSNVDQPPSYEESNCAAGGGINEKTQNNINQETEASAPASSIPDKSGQ